MKRLMIFLVVILGLSILPTLDHHALAYSGTRSHSSFSSHSSSSRYHSSYSRTGSYSTGYRSPSSRVTSRSTTSNSSYYGTPTHSTSHSVLSHTAAFGAGALLGSMFHPFGWGHYGGYGYSYGSGYYGGGASSILGGLLDVLAVVIIIGIIKRIFFGRRRY